MCIYFILAYTTLTFGDQVAALLFDEDHYFENVGALSLFIASVIFFYAFFLTRKHRIGAGIFWGRLLTYLGLAILFFFGAGEEISWGQRIFGIAQPEILAEQNVQGELNIHNLAFFENSNLLKSDTIFTYFWFGFAVIVPLFSVLSTGFRRFAEKWTPITHWGIGALFLFNYACAGISKIIFQTFYDFPEIPFVQALQEVKESNYELLFVFLAWFVLWELNQLIEKEQK
jgi:hypothetical protein